MPYDVLAIVIFNWLRHKIKITHNFDRNSTALTLAQEIIRFQMSESETEGVTLHLPSFKHSGHLNLNQGSLTVNQEQPQKISQSRNQSRRRCLGFFLNSQHFPMQKTLKHNSSYVKTQCASKIR